MWTKLQISFKSVLFLIRFTSLGMRRRIDKVIYYIDCLHVCLTNWGICAQKRHLSFKFSRNHVTLPCNSFANHRRTGAATHFSYFVAILASQQRIFLAGNRSFHLEMYWNYFISLVALPSFIPGLTARTWLDLEDNSIVKLPEKTFRPILETFSQGSGLIFLYGEWIDLIFFEIRSKPPHEVSSPKEAFWKTFLSSYDGR